MAARFVSRAGVARLVCSLVRDSGAAPLGGNATRGALRSSSLWVILRYGRSVLESKITFRSDKMAACLQRLGIGIIGALSIFGAQLTAMSSADARHLRGSHRHDGYWAGYRMVGGFALGARTYTYFGYPRYDTVVVYPSAPVVRVRY